MIVGAGYILYSAVRHGKYEYQWIMKRKDVIVVFVLSPYEWDRRIYNNSLILLRRYKSIGAWNTKQHKWGCKYRMYKKCITCGKCYRNIKSCCENPIFRNLILCYDTGGFVGSIDLPQCITLGNCYTNMDHYVVTISEKIKCMEIPRQLEVEVYDVFDSIN